MEEVIFEPSPKGEEEASMQRGGARMFRKEKIASAKSLRRHETDTFKEQRDQCVQEARRASRRKGWSGGR